MLTKAKTITFLLLVVACVGAGVIWIRRGDGEDGRDGGGVGEEENGSWKTVTGDGNYWRDETGNKANVKAALRENFEVDGAIEPLQEERGTLFSRALPLYLVGDDEARRLQSDSSSSTTTTTSSPGTVDLTKWAVQSYPATSLNGWQIAQDGLSVLQTRNSAPSLFCSDFDADGSTLGGMITVETSSDDDFIGFALGYNDGDNIDPEANWYLVDWKQRTQSWNFGCGGSQTGLAGLAISEVTGIPYNAELWSHASLECGDPSGSVSELVRGTNYGDQGWLDATTYVFRFEVSDTDLLVYINDILEINITGSFDTRGKFCYYTFSQRGVRYSGLTRSTVQPSQAPSTPTTSTTASTTSTETTSSTTTTVECGENLFGPACEPLPFISSVVPNDAPAESGSTLLRITGVNFGVGSTFACDFRPASGAAAAASTTGSLDDEGGIRCSAPAFALSSGNIEAIVELSVTVDNVRSFNELVFRFYGSCPPDYCSGNGSCSFGSCICDAGFEGDSCEIIVQEPVIDETASPFSFSEGEIFSYQMALESGSGEDTEWNVLRVPTTGTMIVDRTSGLIRWEGAAPDDEMQYAEIEVRNSAGQDSVGLQFNVQPSYYTLVKLPSYQGTETPRTTPPSPPFSFEIETRSVDTDDIVTNKTVVLWVVRADEESDAAFFRKLDGVTNDDGTVVIEYLPYSSDAGLFNYGAQHPMYTNVTKQGQIAISGITPSPAIAFYEGFMEFESFADAFTLKFLGEGLSFTNIQLDIEQVSSTFGLSLDYSLTSTSAVGAKVGEATQVSSVNISFAVDATEAFPIQLPVYFSISTDEGDYLRTFVDVTIRSRKADLVVQTQETLDVVVDAQTTAPTYSLIVLTNKGSSEASIVNVLIPEDQDFLKVVSDPVIPSIGIDDESSVSLSFKAPPSTPVGTTFVGSVVFASPDSSASLPFKVTVVSSLTGTLTIVAEDEFTFFAPDTPNLANVQVQVTSQPQGESRALVTDDSGTVSFFDLTEGFYEITAQKLGHSFYKGSVYFSPPSMSVPVFLSRDLVSYVFSVVEVPITETYVIDVRTTFETNVPAPVVVFEPVALDLERLGSGEISEIFVKATNHGLIAADHVSINFSDRLANVVFESPEDQIGTLPTKSSATYTVKVKPLLSFELPGDRVQFRKGNNIFLLRIPLEDEQLPFDEISLVVIPEDDPFGGQVSIVFNSTGDITSMYGLSSRILIDFPEDGSDAVVRDMTDTPIGSRSDHYFGPPLQEKPTSLSLNPLDNIGDQVIEAFSPEGRALSTICISALVDCELLKEIVQDLINLACGKGLGKVVRCGTLCSRVLNPIAIGICAGVCVAVGSIFCDELAELGGELSSNICDCPELGVKYCYSYFCRDDVEVCHRETMSNCTFCFPVDGGGGEPGAGGTGVARGGIPSGGSICSKTKTSGDKRENPVIPQGSSLLGLYRAVKGITNIKNTGKSLTKAATKLRAASKIQSKTKKAIATAEASILYAESHQGVQDSVTFVSDVVSPSMDPDRFLVEDAFLLQNPGLLDLVLKTKLLEDFANALSFFFEFSAGTVPDGDTLFALSEALSVTLSDESDGGTYVSVAELDALPSVDVLDLSLFAARWNATISSWDTASMPTSTELSNPFDLNELDRLMDKFVAAVDQVELEGRGTIVEAWASALEGQQVEAAKRLAGVCASVQLLIEQELTLTRVGFEAKLEIDNSAASELQNVSVTLNAILFDPTGVDDATDLFVFGEPNLFTVTSVDGNGMLGPQSVGQVKWLILALREAAPQFETRYQVGGQLSYTLDEDTYVDNLVPATITVRPDPRLYLTYFHSRIAYSDDPFTDEIEPPIPFYLGLLLENRGYGDAFNVSILSAQPNITENEKGLLVDFEVLGARLGNEATEKSLEITFGSVPARKNRVGVWEMVSSLTGRFYNFTASYVYNGPIDDDRLSFIESVEIFELTHVVRVVGDHPRRGDLDFVDDRIDDFLVNKFPDADSLPDTVYTSDAEQQPFSVARRIDVFVPTTFVPSSDETEMRVTIELDPTLPSVGDTDWVYIRLNDPMGRTDFVLHSAIDTVSEYELIPNINSWQTSRTEYLAGGGTNELDYIHLFDLDDATTYELVYKKVSPVVALEPVGITSDNATISWEPDIGSSSSFTVLVKPSGTPDRYFKSAGMTPRTLYTISSLDPGREYDIKILSGEAGKFESTGTTVSLTTPGVSLCGNGVLDGNEECDGGNDNDDSIGPCTSACLSYIAPVTLEILLSSTGSPLVEFFASDDVLWVTIMSSSTYQVDIIEYASLRCGKDGTEASPLNSEPCVYDANDDGMMDWEVGFRASDLGFDVTDDNLFDTVVEVLLTAGTTSGYGQFTASQALSVSTGKKSKGKQECKVSSKDTKGNGKGKSKGTRFRM